MIDLKSDYFAYSYKDALSIFIGKMINLSDKEDTSIFIKDLIKLIKSIYTRNEVKAFILNIFYHYLIQVCEKLYSSDNPNNNNNGNLTIIN